MLHTSRILKIAAQKTQILRAMTSLRYFSNQDTSPCCPPGSEPYRAPNADYKPMGEVVELDKDLRCYVSGRGTKAVVHCYDVYGFEGGRSKEITDQIGEAEYVAIMPDFYRTHPWFHDKDVGMDVKLEWLTQFEWGSVSEDLFGRVLPYLKSKGITEFAISGTCWGAWVVFKACVTGKFKCGVSWHPSVHLAQHFGEKEVDLANRIHCPQLILPAGNDQPNMMEGGEVIETLKKRGIEVEHQVFHEMKHGYMTRGDMSQEAVRRDVTLATEKAIAFFKTHLQ